MYIFVGFVQENARSSGKNITTYVFFLRKASVFLRKATQRTRSKKKHALVSVVFLSACTPRPLVHSLTHSLTLGSLAEIAI